MEKRVLGVPAAGCVLRLWSPVLWQRFAGPVTCTSACLTPSAGGRTWDKGKLWGHTVHSFGSLRFLF